MKKLLIVAVLIALVGTLSAQSAVDKVFNKYAGKDGYTTVVINSFMFKFLSKIETNDPDYEDFKKATSGIESIRILAQDGGGSEGFGKELIKNLPRKEYEELMVVKEVDEEVVFLVKEKDGKISEFLLVVSGNDGNDALIVITGNIDLESISSLAGGLDLPGIENLEEFDEE
ncbi:MAG: DUF4252 domain-containing protein [Bacteroidales bacterium]|jgi:hypothetical protein|nr:DUF4252 domain-containing protein [Bacteroidales bacterium]